GFVVYGGIILGIFAGFLYTRRKKLNFWKYFDIVMPEIALAQAFGRVGCFLAGCCYGEETHNVLHVVFHDSPIAPNGVQLIPTQVYSSLFNFLHFFILINVAKKKKADGQVAGLYLIIYSVGRFIIEFFRGDIERGQIGILSTSQFISIFIFAAGILLYAFAEKISGAKVFAVEEGVAVEEAATAEETTAEAATEETKAEESTENNDEKED
ncbi:MAG: prolipoprotein diacylglyceryl transferase, partial [Lachnospiraceae bacterium]|nr:prolipoprotein diacylglyceryl transferase [Lachnospiraceae bacterium]